MVPSSTHAALFSLTRAVALAGMLSWSNGAAAQADKRPAPPQKFGDAVLQATPSAPLASPESVAFTLPGRYLVTYEDLQLGQVSGYAEIVPEHFASTVTLRHPKTGQEHKLVVSRMFREGRDITLVLEGRSPSAEVPASNPADAVPRLRIGKETAELSATARGASAKLPIGAAPLMDVDRVTLRLKLADDNAELTGSWSYFADPLTRRDRNGGGRTGKFGNIDEAGRPQGVAYGSEAWRKVPPAIAGVVVLEDQALRPYPYVGNRPPGSIDRTLFVYGVNLPTTYRDARNFTSSDAKLSYYVKTLRADVKRGEHPVPEFERGWKRALEMARPEEREALRRMDAVIVDVRMERGVLPGPKQFRLNGAAADWVLQFGDAGADIRFVRGLTEDDQRAKGSRAGSGSEDASSVFVNETIQLEVRTDAPLPLESIPLILGRNQQVVPAPDGKFWTAYRVKGNGRLYRTAPIRLVNRLPPEVQRAAGTRYVEVQEGDTLLVRLGAAELLQPRKVQESPSIGAAASLDPLRGPLYDAKARVVQAPSRIGGFYKEALFRTIQCENAARERFALLLAIPPQRIVIDDLDKLSDEQFDEVSNIIVSELQVRRIAITWRSLAAMVMLRDEFVRQMEDASARIPQIRNDAELRAFRDKFSPYVSDPQFPLSIIQVKSPSTRLREERALAALLLPGNWLLATEVPYELAFREDYTSDYFRHYFGDDVAAARRWSDEAVKEGLKRYRENIDTSIARAKAAGYCNARELASITGFSFDPVVAALLPKLMKLEGKPGEELRWVPDRKARAAVNSIDVLAAAIKAQKDLSSADTAVVLATASLVTAVPVLFSEAALLAAASLAVDAADLASTVVNSTSDYLESKREVAFAVGATELLGTGRAREALANESSAMSLAMDIGMSGVGAAGGTLDVIDKMRRASGYRALERLRKDGARALEKMQPSEARNLRQVIDELRIADPKKLSRTQQARMAALKEAEKRVGPNLLARLDALQKLPPVAAVPRPVSRDAPLQVAEAGEVVPKPGSLPKDLGSPAAQPKLEPAQPTSQLQSAPSPKPTQTGSPTPESTQSANQPQPDLTPKSTATRSPTPVSTSRPQAQPDPSPKPPEPAARKPESTQSTPPQPSPKPTEPRSPKPEPAQQAKPQPQPDPSPKPPEPKPDATQPKPQSQPEPVPKSNEAGSARPEAMQAKPQPAPQPTPKPELRSEAATARLDGPLEEKAARADTRTNERNRGQDQAAAAARAPPEDVDTAPWARGLDRRRFVNADGKQVERGDLIAEGGFARVHLYDPTGRDPSSVAKFIEKQVQSAEEAADLVKETENGAMMLKGDGVRQIEDEFYAAGAPIPYYRQRRVNHRLPDGVRVERLWRDVFEEIGVNEQGKPAFRVKPEFVDGMLDTYVDMLRKRAVGSDIRGPNLAWQRIDDPRAPGGRRWTSAILDGKDRVGHLKRRDDGYLDIDGTSSFMDDFEAFSANRSDLAKDVPSQGKGPIVFRSPENFMIVEMERKRLIRYDPAKGAYVDGLLPVQRVKERFAAAGLDADIDRFIRVRQQSAQPLPQPAPRPDTVRLPDDYLPSPLRADTAKSTGEVTLKYSVEELPDEMDTLRLEPHEVLPPERAWPQISEPARAQLTPFRERADVRNLISEDPARLNRLTQEFSAQEVGKALRWDAHPSLDSLQGALRRARERVDAPRTGLYDGIDPQRWPPGWEYKPDPGVDEKTGIPFITTTANGPGLRPSDRGTANYTRSYDAASRTLSFDLAQRRTAEPANPWTRTRGADQPEMIPGKGTPTSTYITLQQMKTWRIEPGTLQQFRWNNVIHVDSLLHMGWLLRQYPGVPPGDLFRHTPSYKYGETTIIQSGHVVQAVEATLGDMIPVSKVITESADKDLARALAVRYGLGPDDLVPEGFNVTAKVGLHPQLMTRAAPLRRRRRSQRWSGASGPRPCRRPRRPAERTRPPSPASLSSAHHRPRRRASPHTRAHPA